MSALEENNVVLNGKKLLTENNVNRESKNLEIKF